MGRQVGRQVRTYIVFALGGVRGVLNHVQKVVDKREVACSLPERGICDSVRECEHEVDIGAPTPSTSLVQ